MCYPHANFMLTIWLPKKTSCPEILSIFWKPYWIFNKNNRHSIVQCFGCRRRWQEKGVGWIQTPALLLWWVQRGWSIQLRRTTNDSLHSAALDWLAAPSPAIYLLATVGRGEELKSGSWPTRRCSTHAQYPRHNSSQSALSRAHSVSN